MRCIKQTKMSEMNFDEAMTPEQKEEAKQFLTHLLCGRADGCVLSWINSGRKITYEQIENLKRCQSADMLFTILDGYSKGATVTFFKVVNKIK